jgi:hypothetical protein
MVRDAVRAELVSLPNSVLVGNSGVFRLDLAATIMKKAPNHGGFMNGFPVGVAGNSRLAIKEFGCRNREHRGLSREQLAPPVNIEPLIDPLYFCWLGLCTFCC